MQADKLAHEFRMRQENDKLYEIAILSALAQVSLFIVLRFITAKTVYSASHIVNATGLIFITLKADGIWWRWRGGNPPAFTVTPDNNHENPSQPPGNPVGLPVKPALSLAGC